jgi:hypothetical protein
VQKTAPRINGGTFCNSVRAAAGTTFPRRRALFFACELFSRAAHVNGLDVLCGAANAGFRVFVRAIRVGDLRLGCQSNAGDDHHQQQALAQSLPRTRQRFQVTGHGLTPSFLSDSRVDSTTAA